MTPEWRAERLPELVRALAARPAADGVAAEMEALVDALLPP